MAVPAKINDHAMDALGYNVYGNIGIRGFSGHEKNYEDAYTY